MKIIYDGKLLMKFICELIKTRWRFITFLLIISALVYACHEMNAADGKTEKLAKPMRIGETRNLALEGYNYTNSYIADYSVNGQGGGNLRVSGPSSGGGGTVCCVQYTAGNVSTVKVRWQVGGCMFDEGRDKKGKMAQQIHSFYKEKEVTVDSNVPNDPHYFEVHIYSDDHVEAMITEHSSKPRLILSKDRGVDFVYPRCPDGKRPEN